ncbi:MAG: hypothetical protein ACRELX_15785, partial [Longimicrobiales bacterium]
MMRALAGGAFRAAAVACLAVLAPTMPVAAQDPSPATPLDRVETMIASGRLTEARTSLERWTTEHPAGSRSATPAQRAHALLLQG